MKSGRLTSTGPLQKGLDSQFDPVERSDKGCSSEEVPGELVITGGDAPPVFNAAEVILNLVAAPIKSLRAIRLGGGVAAARDDRQGAFILDLLTNLFAVVGFVGGDGQRQFWRVEYVANDLTVVDLPTGHHKI